MSNMKIISIMDHADQRVKEDVYVTLHAVAHSVRTDLQAKIDAMGVKVDKLRADVDQLQEGTPLSSNG